jgi:hypothetical protein
LISWPIVAAKSYDEGSVVAIDTVVRARIPNEETRSAMRELEAGGGKTFNTVADLMADLNEDD